MLQSLARIRDPRTARNSGKVESHPRRAASVIRALPPPSRRDRRRTKSVWPRSRLAESPTRHQLRPARSLVLRLRSRLAPEPRISRPGYMGRSSRTWSPAGRRPLPLPRRSSASSSLHHKAAVRFAESAITDLQAIRGWRADKGVPAVGARIVKVILTRIESLRDDPETGRIVPEPDRTFVRELIHPPFRTVCRLEPQSIRSVLVRRIEQLPSHLVDEHERSGSFRARLHRSAGSFPSPVLEDAQEPHAAMSC